MRYRSYQGFRLTPVWFLIFLNLILFIATIISSELIFLLGLQPATFLEQPWTMVTNMFVHGGFWHIMFNMLALYFLGTSLSRLVGDKRFLITYFGGGILGNILFLLLGPLFSVAVGASGAIFALGGTLAVMTPKLRVFIFPIPAPIPLWIAVIILLLLSFVNYNIAWQAHLGGLVFGLIAGFIFRRRERYVYR